MRQIIFLSLLLPIFISCHEIDDYDNNPKGNFDALWNIIDQHYCFFDEKDVDWNDVYSRYAPRVNNSMSREDLFILCSDMLNELRD